MHSSSLGARPGGFLCRPGGFLYRPGGFLCRHKLSSQCALGHKHHNLNNLGIRQDIWENLFGKIDFVFKTIRKNRFSDPQKPEKSISVLKVFGKIDFHYAGEVTHPTGLPLLAAIILVWTIMAVWPVNCDFSGGFRCDISECGKK